MVNHMVYCDYISNINNTVTYAYGSRVDDITGKVIFDFSSDVIEIINSPNSSEDAPVRHIKRLYTKHRNKFKNKIFNKKISYE